MRLRTQFGNFRGREFYGFASGPLIDDVLAARRVPTKLDRDCSLKGLGESNETHSIDPGGRTEGQIANAIGHHGKECGSLWRRGSGR